MSPTVERSPGASLSPRKRSDIRKKRPHDRADCAPPEVTHAEINIAQAAIRTDYVRHNAGVVEYILRYLMVW